MPLEEIRMNETVLSTIRKLMGMESDYTHFDNDLLIHINTASGILYQLGIEPDNVLVTDKTTWSELLLNENLYDMAKTYVYLFVKKIFDPPANSFVADSYEKTLKEIEWRILVMADSVKDGG